MSGQILRMPDPLGMVIHSPRDWLPHGHLFGIFIFIYGLLFICINDVPAAAASTKRAASVSPNPCHPQCICTSTESDIEVDCTLANLDNFPEAEDLPDPTYITKLLLGKNNIFSVLESDLASLINLVVLDLSQNKISELSEDVFKVLTNLQDLSLQGNKLFDLPVNIFKFNTVLTTLNMSYNSIVSLPQDIFATTKSNLQLLDLNNNALKSLPANMFDNFDSIQKINLANNPWVCECSMKWLSEHLLNLESSGVDVADRADTVCSGDITHTSLLDLPQEFWCPEEYLGCYTDVNMNRDDIVLFAYSFPQLDKNICIGYCFDLSQNFGIISNKICLCGNSNSCLAATCSSFSQGDSVTCTTGDSHLYVSGAFVVSAGITFAPNPVLTAGKVHTFTASISIKNIETYNWNLGDGQEATSTSVMHNYVLPGEYSLGLTVCTAKPTCETASVPVKVQTSDLTVSPTVMCQNYIEVFSPLPVEAKFTQGFDEEYMWIRQQSSTSSTSTGGGCKMGWTSFRQKCLKLYTTIKDVNSASNDCLSEKGSLLTLDFAVEIQEVIDLLSLTSFSVFTDAMKIDNVYTWTVNSNVAFFDTSIVTSDNTEDCVLIDGAAGILVAVTCTNKHSYVCQTDVVACPDGGVLYASNRHCYRQSTEQHDWQSAENECKTLSNGHLATVDSQELHDFINSDVLLGISEAWIGLSDQESDEYYLWASNYPKGSYNGLGAETPVYNCLVASNSGNWESARCQENKYYICEYTLNGKLSMETYVAGVVEMDLRNSKDLTSLSPVTMPTGTQDSEVMLFPGLWFSYAGNVVSFTFQTKDLERDVTLLLQVYRPTCPSGQFLLPPGYLGNGGQYASCVTTLTTYDLSSRDCESRESFCLLSDTCQPFSTPCSCSVISNRACTNLYVENQPDYVLVHQMAVTVPSGSTNIYTVLASEMSVEQHDILGFQKQKSLLVIDCNGPSTSQWRQNISIIVPQSDWLTKGDHLNKTNAVEVTDSLCNIQALYAQAVVVTVPPALKYVSDAETYTFSVFLPSRLITESCNIDAEEVVDGIEWLYPKYMYTSGSVGTIGIEYSFPTTYVIKVSKGSHLNSSWDLMSASTSFYPSCPDDVNVLDPDLCTTDGVTTTNPFTYLQHLFDISVPSSSALTVSVSNHFGAQSITVNVEKTVKIEGLSIVTSNGQVIIEQNIEVQFDVLFIKGFDLVYSYTVNGAQQSSNLDHFLYVFSSPGSYTIEATASNFLGKESATIDVDVKARAYITNFIFTFPNVDDTSYITEENDIVSLQTSSTITRRADVNITWYYGDGDTSNLEKTSYGSTLRVTSDHIYTKAADYICMIVIDDGFDVVNFTADVSIRIKIPSVLITSESIGIAGVLSEFLALISGSSFYGDVICSWDFGDGMTQTTNDRLITYAYSTAAQYLVTLMVDNGISTQNTDFPIRIEEAITGLSLTYNGPVEFGKNAEVTAVLDSGTNVEYIFQIADLGINQQLTVSIFQYTFDAMGAYNITVTVHNDVSTATGFIIVHVINDTTMELHNINHDQCFPPNENVSLTADVITLHPETLDYKWDFGDGVMYQHVDAQMVSHTYTTVGTYNSSVTVEGQIVYSEICVQDKIAGVDLENDGPWELLESNNDVTITFTASASQGTHIKYTWRYGTDEVSSFFPIFSIVVSATGIYTVEVLLSNRVSTLNVISDAAVQTRISNVAVICVDCTTVNGIPYTATANEKKFEAVVGTGTDVIFLWDFNDDTNKMTGSPTTHSYYNFGSYAIALTANNLLTSEMATLDVFVVELVAGLSVTANSLSTAVNGAVQFEAIVTAGSHISFSWITCSGCPANVTSAGVFVFSDYSSPGLYQLTVTVSNVLSSQQDSIIIEAQNSIIEVALTSNITTANYVAINEFTFFSASTDVIPVNFMWTIKKNGIQQTDYQGENLTYAFSSIGIYEVAVTASNDVSLVKETLEMTVLELVNDVSIIINGTSPMATGTSILITANMSSGSDASYIWKFLQAPNGAEVLSISTLAFGWIFTDVGTYELEVSVSNALSKEAATLLFEMINPVAGLTIESVYSTSTVYLSLNDEPFFSACVETGTSVEFEWHLDSLQQNNLKVINAQNFSFVFSDVGEYKLTTDAFNDVSSVTASTIIYVDIPLQSLNVVANSTNVKVGELIRFEASHNTEATNVLYDFNLDGTSLTNTDAVFTYNFNEAGSKLVTVTAYNNISSFSAVITIFVLEPITDLDIPACQTGIPVDTSINIGASVTMGTSVSYDWLLTVESGIVIEYTNVFDYIFVSTGLYSITVTASNAVSVSNYTCFIEVQGVINNINIEVQRYLFTQTEVQFLVMGDHLYGATYVWTFLPNTETYSKDVDFLNYTFSIPDTYLITLNVSNDVSWKEVELEIIVYDIKCQKPSIKRAGMSEVRIMRSRALEIEMLVDTLGCSVNALFYQWQFFIAPSCTDDLTNMITLSSDIILDSSTVVIRGWTLDYGEYCVEFTTGYTHLLYRVSETTKLVVLDSQLKAIIGGGSIRFYPVNEILVLNASRSYDPDANVGHSSATLMYEWSCSSEDNGELIPVTDDGCSAIHQMTESFVEVEAKTLSIHRKYIISLTVNMAGRKADTDIQVMTFSPNDIPVLDIQCQSCPAKNSYRINPKEQVSVFVNCLNCKSTDAITYAWSVESDTGKSLNLDLTTTKTSSNRKSIVVREGILEFYSYTFKVDVTRSNSHSTSTTGWGAMKLQPNEPPSSGTCYVGSSAVALETGVNVICDGWQDPDSLSNMLYFKITAVRENSDTNLEEEHLLYYGTSATQTIHLTTWPGSSDNNVIVVVYVVDVLGGSTKAASSTVTVIHFQLSVNQTFTDYMEQKVDEELAAFINEKKTSALLQYTNILAIELNGVTEGDQNTVYALLRKKLLHAVATHTVTSVSQLQQLASVISSIMNDPSQVDADDVKLVMGAINNMVVWVNDFVRQGLNWENFGPLTIVSIMSNTLRSVGLLQTTAEDMNINFQRENVDNLMAIMKNMMSSLVSTQVESEEPIVLDVGSFKIVGRRTRLVEPEEQFDGCLFNLDPDLLASYKLEGTEVLQITSVMNQIMFSSTSNEVDTPVASLSFDSSSNPAEEIVVRDLSDSNIFTVIMFSSEVDPFEIKNYTFIGVEGYNPRINVNYSTISLDAGASKKVVLNTTGIPKMTSLHVQVFATLSDSENSDAMNNIEVYLGINYEATKSRFVKKKNIYFDIEPNTDHRKYTFFVSAGEFDPTSKYSLSIFTQYNVVVEVGLYTSACMYYNKESLLWDREGCFSTEKSITTVKFCQCNHLTSFGGLTSVLLNVIDFADLAKLDPGTNPVAIATCGVVLVVYVVLVLICRQLDKADLLRIATVPLCGKDGSHKFEITVVTGRMVGAGTTAHVGIQLYGEHGKSNTRHLSKPEAFQRTCQDSFIIAHDTNLGNIWKILIWHDNSGISPSWYLDHVLVKDLQTNKIFHFFASNWLSLEVEKGTIQKEVLAAGPAEITSFSRMFGSAILNCLADRHLWFSLLNRPAMSRFTRVQRVTCCVTLLYTFMCVNVVWYGVLTTVDDSLDSSSWFGWEEIVLSIVTNVLMFPLSFGLIYLFKKSRSAVTVFDQGSKPHTALTIEIDNMLDDCQYDHSFHADSFQTQASHEDVFFYQECNPKALHTNKLRRTCPNLKQQKPHLPDKKLRRFDSNSSGMSTEHPKIWSSEGILANWPEKAPQHGMDELLPSGSTLPTPARGLLTGDGHKGLDAKRKAKTRVEEGDDILEYFNKLEMDFDEKDKIAKTKRSGSTRLPVTIKKRASSWESLKDILDSDDESIAPKKTLRKNASTSTLGSSVKTTSFTSWRPIHDKLASDIHKKSSILTRASESIIHGASEYGYTKPPQPIPSAHSTVHRMDILDPPTRTSSCWLPPCFVYVAYTLCFALSVLSITLVMLYGYKFGTIVALKWLVALVFSLVTSIFIMETIKSLTMAFYLSAVEKKDWDDDIIDVAPTVDTSIETVKDVKFKPLAGFALLHAMEEGQKIARMNLMIRQCIAYIFYLVVVMAICYINYSYGTFLSNKHMATSLLGNNRDGAIDYQSIHSHEDFWQWSENTLPQVLHTETSDYEQYGTLLGVARLRQIRGAQGLCQGLGITWDMELSELVDRNCSQDVTMGEDRTGYGEGWDLTAPNLTWMYQSAEELDSYTKQGNVTMYNGGGYVQYLGANISSTIQKLASLHNSGWISSRSRAVLCEFSVYSASTDLVTSVTLLVEFPITGGVFTSYDIQSQKLMWFVDGVVDPVLICEIFLFLLLVYLIIHISASIHHKRWSYFLYLWNWHELVLTLLTITAISIYIACVVDSTITRTSFASNPQMYINFERVVNLHLTMVYVHAWVLFLLILKVAKTMRFISFFHTFDKILSNSFSKICGCFLIFLILICSWGMLGYLMFGRAVLGFESFGASLGSLLAIVRGTYDFLPLLDYQPIFSHFYFYSYYAFVYGVTMALVIAVLCDAYKTSRSQMFCKSSLDMQDYEMIEFMLKRFKLWAGITKPKPAFRRVKFEGLPSISSRATSSYSNRTLNSDSTGNSVPIVLEHVTAALTLQSLISRIAPTWEDVLDKFKKIEALEKEEERLMRKTVKQVKHWQSKVKKKQLEKEKEKILSSRPPISQNRRQISKSVSESSSTQQSNKKSHRLSITQPFSKGGKKVTHKSRRNSDQGAREGEEEEEQTSQENKTSFNRFFQRLKMKDAWDSK